MLRLAFLILISLSLPGLRTQPPPQCGPCPWTAQAAAVVTPKPDGRCAVVAEVTVGAKKVRLSQPISCSLALLVLRDAQAQAAVFDRWGAALKPTVQAELPPPAAPPAQKAPARK